MKRILAVLAVFWLVSAAVEPALAQTGSGETQQALNVNEAENLRLQIKALTELLQAKVPPEPGQAPQTASNRTMADVLDKALDLVSGSVATIAAGVEKAAPHVWRIMILQQYANAVGDILSPWLLVVLVVVYYKIVGKRWAKPTKPDRPDDIGPNFLWWFFARVVPIFLGMIFGIVGIVRISRSLKMLINPEYYAIKDLIAIILQNNPL